MLSRLKQLVRKAIVPPAQRDPLSALPADIQDLIHRIHTARLTYLSDQKLASIAQTCQQIEATGLPGMFIEAGCALGGSTILIASAKSSERPLSVYDVFGMIPPPTSQDTPDVHQRYRTIVQGHSAGLDGDRYYGYEGDLYGKVQANLRRFGVDQQRQSVALIKGLLQDTMDIYGPVAFAHVDVDWYDPVRTCLERIFPHLVPGGSIILDDYHDWGGCRKATDEFLRTVTGQFTLDDSASSMKITRSGSTARN